MARTATLPISRELLKLILHLPESFNVLTAYMDLEVDCLNLVVESEEFDDYESEYRPPLIDVAIGTENSTWRYVL